MNKPAGKLQQPDLRLADILLDDQHFDILREEFEALSDEKKKAVRDLITGSQAKAHQSLQPKSPKLWTITEQDIGIPPEVRESFAIWQADISHFFYNNQIRKKPATMAELYTLTKNTTATAAASRIRLRFLYYAFYKCRIRLPGGEGIAHLRQAIPGDGDEIKKNIVSWIFLGKRLADLVSHLGGTGYFFVLPTEFADSVWLKQLSKPSQMDAAADFLSRLNLQVKVRSLGRIILLQ